MSGLVWKRLAWVAALAGWAASVACTVLESPRQRATRAVERLGEAGIELPLAAEATLRIPPGGVEVLAMDAYATEGGALDAFAQLSVDGTVGRVEVSYLGNERLALSCGARRCEIEGELAARLRGVLEALVQRQQALRARDVGALSRLAAAPGPMAPEDLERQAGREVAAWYIRVETDSAIVGEADPAGAQRRLHLRDEGDGWRFVGGLL